MKSYLVLFLTILLVVGFVVEVGAEEFTSGEWEIEIREDPLTDEFQFLMANYHDKNHALAIRYMNNSLKVIMGTKYLGINWDEDLQDVMYRFDQGEVVESSWEHSAQNRALSFQDNDTDTKKEFIEKLMGHEEIAIGYWPYNENRKTVVYDLTGFTDGITPYLDQIGLSELK